MKPGDTLFINFNPDTTAPETAFLYMKHISRIIPDYCGIALFPAADCQIRTMDRDVGYAYLEKIKQTLDGMEGPNDNGS